MEIGEIKEMCFNKDNVIIPSGYLECNGQEITDDMFPELHFHLSDGCSEEPIKLPDVKRKKNGEEYIFVTLIAYTDKEINDIRYDAEFIVKTEEQNQNNGDTTKTNRFKHCIWRKML